MSKRKIPMKNFRSDLACIFKKRIDEKGYKTWEELTNELGLDNKRTFVDFFNGKQCIPKEVLEQTFELLDIPKEYLDTMVEKVIKYKIKF